MSRIQRRLLPWFGADTEVVDHYAAPLLTLTHVTIPFAGGCSMISRLSQDDSAVQHINASDLHHYVSLYADATRWDITEIGSRNSGNSDVAELMITNERGAT